MSGPHRNPLDGRRPSCRGTLAEGTLSKLLQASTLGPGLSVGVNLNVGSPALLTSLQGKSCYESRTCLSPRNSVIDDYAAANHDVRTTDDDDSVVILIIVVGTALIHISSAPMLLGLAWRHSTVVPPRFLTVVPSRGTLIRITVRAILISVALLPFLVGTSIVVRGVRIPLSLRLPILRT